MDKRLMFEILSLATEDDFYFWELMPEKLKERGLIRSEEDLLDALFMLQDQGYLLLYGGDAKEVLPFYDGDVKEVLPLMKRNEVLRIEPYNSDRLQCFRATDKGAELYFSDFFSGMKSEIGECGAKSNE